LIEKENFVKIKLEATASWMEQFFMPERLYYIIVFKDGWIK